MNKRHSASAVVGIFCIIVTAGLARAAESPLVGLWIYKGDGVRIDMDLKADGRCTATAAAGDKTSVVNGTFKHVRNELVITPGKGKPITYGLKLAGEEMTLSGGDFGAGNALTFAKRNIVADAAADVRPPAAEPRGGNKKDPEAGKKDDAKKPADEANLPGGKWDTHILEQHFTVLKTKEDSVKNTVTFLLERKDDGFMAFDVAFYDEEDDVKLGITYMAFDPSLGSAIKGERTRGTVEFLPDEKMKKCVKVIVTKR